LNQPRNLLARHDPKKKKEPEEPIESDTTAPPPAPIQTDQEKSYTKHKIDQLFWLRIALAVIAGTAATFMFDSIEGEERRWTSIAFMITIFIVSIGIAKNMRLQLPKSDRKKIVTTGIGSYIFIYLFMWIFTYTLVNLPNESGLQTPFT